MARATVKKKRKTDSNVKAFRDNKKMLRRQQCHTQRSTLYLKSHICSESGKKY